MFKQLMQAQSISIIGGADGPTSIYISPLSLWQFFVILIFIIALIVFAICGLIKNIKKKNRVGIIVFAFLNLCFLSFVLYNLYSIVNVFSVKRQFDHNFSQESEQVHFYTVEEIENTGIDNINLNKNSFPIIKLNKGITIGGDSNTSFVFFNKADYKIGGFVFYMNGFEVPISYDFIPGHCYSINFEKISKEYVLNSVGVFYSKDGNEKTELWTDELENGIYCLFAED